MSKSWLHTSTLVLAMGACFLLGRYLPGPAELTAQGRGPVNVPPPSIPVPGPVTVGTTPNAAAPTVIPDGGGQSAAANGFLAVTGSYGIGTQVLYVIDTNNMHMAVYEARGGSTGRISLIGARRIDLDLQLENYNDRSEYDYRALKQEFEKRGKPRDEAETGLEKRGR